MVGTAMLPTLVKSLAQFDIFTRFHLAAPMVVGMVVAVIGGILLTILGSVVQGQMSEDEKSKQVEEVVVAKDAKDIQSAMRDAINSMEVPALSEKIDSLWNSHAGTILKATEHLFETFDADGNGVLQNAEVTQCLDALTSQVMSEIKKELAKIVSRESSSDKEAAEKFEQKWKKVNDKKIRAAIENVVDPDHDGEITKAEAMAGFKKVVELIQKS